MAGVIFSKTTAGLTDGDLARIGKISTPVKMIMKSESDLLSKKEGPLDWLFNIDKSSNFAETIVTENGFGLLQPVADGGAKPLMSYKETSKVTIEHFEISGKFIAKASMIEDSVNVGKVSTQLERAAKKFINSYYKSRHYIGTKALTNGLSTTFVYEGDTKSIACADGYGLFYNAHKVGADGDTQANAFHNTRANGVGISASEIETILGEAAVRMLNMLDENGEPLGYVADTIVIPGNNAKLITAVKQACGSLLTSNSSGAASNEINIQFNNWHLIVLPTWRLSAVTDCPMIIMSSEANESLYGNVFYDRLPFSVEDYKDYDTSNYCMTGRTRVGVGFGTYKHAIHWESLAYSDTSLHNGATATDYSTAVTI